MTTLKAFIAIVAILVAVIFGGMGYSAIDRRMNFEQVTAEVLTTDQICQTQVTHNYGIVKTRRTSKWRGCDADARTGKTGKHEMTYGRGVIHVRYRSPADGQVHVTQMHVADGNKGASRAIAGRKWEILAHTSEPLRVEPL